MQRSNIERLAVQPTNSDMERQAEQAAAVGRVQSVPGHSLAQVRIHDDEQAAALAEQYDARAFTVGQDIFFGDHQHAPETAEGKALLAHELTHAARQEEAGGVVYRQPKPAKAKVAPPDEPFQTVEGTSDVPEDGQATFAKGSSRPNPADVKKIKELVAGKTQPVTVNIHGYAAAEGEDNDAINLSAQRAAAVKRAILSLLPKGSEVHLFAHGQSVPTEEGDVAANRRIGISVADGTLGKSTDFTLSTEPLHTPPRQFQPDSPLIPLPPPSMLTPFRLTRPDTLTPGTPAIPLTDTPVYDPKYLFLPPTPLKEPVPDIGAIRESFSYRGRVMGQGDLDGVGENFGRLYSAFSAWGLPSPWAVWLANKALPTYYDQSLRLEAPSLLEKSDAEINKQLGPGKSIGTITVPLITPGVIESIFGRKLRIPIITD